MAEGEVSSGGDDEDYEEIHLSDDDVEFEEVEYVYGISMPQLPEGLQPLECVILIKGLMMDSGEPTVTALGSDGMTPWEACGMLQMETQRLIQGYVYGGIGSGFMEEDEEEDEE